MAVEIKGLKALKQKLDNLEKTGIIVDTMQKAVELVQAQAKVLAPVDTGNLRGNIHMEVKVSGDSVIGKVYTNTEYAVYVEMGTGSKGSGTYPNTKVNATYRDTPWVYSPDGGETFYTTNGRPAQPYMYPALKANEKRIKRMFEEALKAGIEG